MDKEKKIQEVIQSIASLPAQAQINISWMIRNFDDISLIISDYNISINLLNERIKKAKEENNGYILMLLMSKKIRIQNDKKEKTK